MNFFGKKNKYPAAKTKEHWKKKLDDLSYKVTRLKGTERAFSGKYHDHKSKGVYNCKCCGKELFNSEAKYDSKTGWPSFYRPAAEKSVATENDSSLFMNRVEVLCSNCGAHLGHVFEDGPQPTGLRYCINSVSLDFKADS